MTNSIGAKGYEAIFRYSAVPLWVEDISKLRVELARLRDAEVVDVRAHFRTHPAFLRRMAGLVQVVDVNDAALRLYGAANREELVGPLSATVDLEDELTVSSLVENFAAVFEGRSYLSNESKAVRPDGSPVDIVIYTFMPDGEGMSDYMLVNVIDVGEQRRVERELRRSEERFRSVVEASVQPIVILDAEGNVIFWNEAAHATFGYSAGEALGHPAASFLPSGMVEEILQEALAVTESGALRSFGPRETVVVAKGGRRIPVEFTLAAWNSDTETCYTAIVRDMTQRKAAEEKLIEQAKLLDIASDAIVVIDIDGRIRYWNKSSERIFGWSREEALGRMHDELFRSSQQPDDLRRGLEAAMTAGHWAGQAQYTTKGGAALTGNTRLTLLSDEAGKPYGVLSVTTDETERRALEQELARYQRLDSIGTLAGGIAHDLNNVLTPIVTGVEALAMEEPDEKSARILEIIKTSALRGASVVRQLLDFARGMEGEKTVVDVAKTIDDVCSLIRETFPKSVTLVCDVAPDLRPIFGEAAQIHQVLMNLCVNARDAMPSGGTLVLRARNALLGESDSRTHVEAKPGAYTVVSVSDTGSGIGPAVLERIFDPFFTTKDTGQGTGLGLATALSIIRSHGGFIDVSTTPNLGSSFEAYLPSAEQPPELETASTQGELPKGSGEMILIADDEDAVLQTTRRILEVHGYSVATSVDGADLIAEFTRLGAQVRVVLTDMAMPNLDGLSAIRAIRRIDPHVPIVAMSGLHNESVASHFAGLAVSATLSKPFTIRTLLQTIRAALGADREARSG